jgi:hypothetical protein
LLAIARSPGPDAQDIAVFVGTLGDGAANEASGGQPEWLVGMADPQVLQRFLTDGAGTPGATIFDLPAPAEALRFWFEASSHVGVSDGHDDKLEDRLSPSGEGVPRCNLWIDRIVRLHFYSADAVFAAGAGIPAPLACLDTADRVIDHEAGQAEAGEKWAVSRPRLDAIAERWCRSGSGARSAMVSIRGPSRGGSIMRVSL